MRAGGAAAALALVALVAGPGPAAAAPPTPAQPASPGRDRPRPDRPLGVDTPGVLRQLFLDLPLADARAASAAFEARWVLANDWSVPTTLVRDGRTVEIQLDEQSDRLALSLRLPWARLLGDGPAARRLATTVEWRLTQRWGGYTDGLIEGWHELGGYNRFDRPDYPRDQVALHLGEPGGATLAHLSAPRLAPGDLVLRTALRLAEGDLAAGPWALALRLDLKVPLGRPGDLGGTGGADAGAGLAVSVPLATWLTLHAQGSARLVSPLPGGLPLQPRPWQLGAEASLVAWRGDWALLLESRWLSALFEPGWRLQGDPVQGDAVTAVTRAQNQVTVGLRWRALTAWFSEDWTPGARREVGWIWFYDTNAPDLVLGLAVTAPL